jgi:ATP-dependent DNA helicase DinG
VSDLSAQVRIALDAAVAAIGGSSREGQIEMAEAVANALSDRQNLWPTWFRLLSMANEFL